jgi:hypothetical protein
MPSGSLRGRAPLAQLAEQCPLKATVRGSSPWRRTTITPAQARYACRAFVVAWVVLGRLGPSTGRCSQQRPAHTDLIRVRAGGDRWHCGGVVKVVRTQRCQRPRRPGVAAPTGPMWVANSSTTACRKPTVRHRPSHARPWLNADGSCPSREWDGGGGTPQRPARAALRPDRGQGRPRCRSRWRCPNGRRRRLLTRTGGPMRSGYCCMPFTGTLKSADDDLMSSTVPPPLLADRSPDLRSSGRRPRREPATFQRGIGSCVRRVPIPACAHPVRPNVAMHLSVRSIGLTGTCCRMLSAWSRY